mgnify:FL=1
MLQYLIDKEMWLKYRNNMTYLQDSKILSMLSTERKSYPQEKRRNFNEK